MCEDNDTKYASGSAINNLSAHIVKHILSIREEESQNMCVCMFTYIYMPGLAEVPMCQIYI